MNDRDTDVGHSKDEKTLKKPKEKTSFWSLIAHNDTILQHFKSFYIRKHHNHGKQMFLEVLEEVSKKFKTHPPKQQLLTIERLTMKYFPKREKKVKK